MNRPRLYSIVVTVVEPSLGNGPAGEASLAVRYCDDCRRWGRVNTVHICGQTWREDLSGLLAEMGAEVAS